MFFLNVNNSCPIAINYGSYMFKVLGKPVFSTYYVAVSCFLLMSPNRYEVDWRKMKSEGLNILNNVRSLVVSLSILLITFNLHFYQCIVILDLKFLIWKILAFSYVCLVSGDMVDVHQFMALAGFFFF